MPTLRPRLALPLAGLLIAAAALPSSSQSLSQRSAAAAPAAPATAAPSEADAPVRYRLGPGDRLKMSVFKMEGYETTAEVMSDGTLNLPRLGSVPVWGLTMDGARARITSGYAAILRRPIVYLDLLQARPVRVSISGEVQRPGLYSIGQGGSNQLASTGSGTGGAVIQSAGWPTLVDAVQKAGGITAHGDLRRVTIQRPTAGPGSPVRTVQYNFLQVLEAGGPTVNPLLYDGDSVLIPRAEQLSETELLRVASSTFAPDTISVNVVGEVERPGAQAVKANSPLSQALLSAGGLTRRANAGQVRLLRLEPNGTIRQSAVAYNPAAPMGSQANPPLQQGDVVVVERHGWAKANDTLRSAVEPIAPLVNAGSLFRLLGFPF
ncbi:MAG: SLBB domain-containing protein [Synechococcaceae cyanobacterium]